MFEFKDDFCILCFWKSIETNSAGLEETQTTLIKINIEQGGGGGLERAEKYANKRKEKGMGEG